MNSKRMISSRQFFPDADGSATQYTMNFEEGVDNVSNFYRTLHRETLVLLKFSGNLYLLFYVLQYLIV